MHVSHEALHIFITSSLKVLFQVATERTVISTISSYD